MSRTTDYTDNFYFDISVNNNINYSHYLKSQTTLSEMAQQAFFSPHWESIINLAPIRLERQISLKKVDYSEICKSYGSTKLVRICTLGATILHFVSVITCIVVFVANHELPALYALIGLLALAALLIPVMNRTGRDIARTKAALINEKAILDYLELADKTLKLTTPLP